MSTETIRIIADCREEKSGVVEELRTTAGVEVVIQQLKCGDSDLGNRLVVERKTLWDLAESLKCAVGGGAGAAH